MSEHQPTKSELRELQAQRRAAGKCIYCGKKGTNQSGHCKECQSIYESQGGYGGNAKPGWGLNTRYTHSLSDRL
jgi:hypothetical protein